MTKTVRIENADTTDYKIVVENWEKGKDGAPDWKYFEEPLNYPTAVIEAKINERRYLIIREAPLLPPEQ